MKTKSPKIGLTVTTHRSASLRPEGTELLKLFFDSFSNCGFKYDYCFYVADNESDIPFDYPEHLNIKVFPIEDQSKLGLTGAWNKSLNEAYKDECDIIWNFNDDIVFTPYTNKFIEGIINHDDPHHTYFGPLSDNGGSNCKNMSPGPKPGYTELGAQSWEDIPNGFSFGFTRKFYEKYRHTEKEFFPIDHKFNCGDGKWGGQEGYVLLICQEGARAALVNECWIKHVKLWCRNPNRPESGHEFALRKQRNQASLDSWRQ